MSEVLLRILLRKMEKDYISKDVIRDKIEELEKLKREYDDTPRLYTAYDSFDFQINILKEILGEEKWVVYMI